MTDCRHHPWRRLRDDHPHIDIVFAPLPDDISGYWDGETTIYIDSRLTQSARRSTLEHETWHMRRGIVPTNSILLAREEAVVDELAARSLITIEALIDGLRWCRGVTGAELAEEVWTDQHTLNVRLATLTLAERRHIEIALSQSEA